MITIACPECGAVEVVWRPDLKLYWCRNCGWAVEGSR